MTALLLIIQAAIATAPPAARRPDFYQSNKPLPSEAKSCNELRRAFAKQKTGSIGKGWRNDGGQVDCKTRSVLIRKTVAYPVTRHGPGWQRSFQHEVDYVCKDWFIGGLVRRGWRFRTEVRFTDRAYTFLVHCPGAR